MKLKLSDLFNLPYKIFESARKVPGKYLNLVLSGKLEELEMIKNSENTATHHPRF